MEKINKEKMRYHSNKNLDFKKDNTKSYVYVEDKGKTIGIFCWDYKNLRWKFDRYK